MPGSIKGHMLLQCYQNMVDELYCQPKEEVIMVSFIEKKIIHICIAFVAWKMKGGKRQRRKKFFRNKSLWIYHFQNFCEDLFSWIDSYQIFCEDLKLQTFVYMKISPIKVSENRIILFLKNLSFKEIVINKTFVSFHFTGNKSMIIPC